MTVYRDLADARRQLGRFLRDVYNRKRIHSALGYARCNRSETIATVASGSSSSRPRTSTRIRHPGLEFLLDGLGCVLFNTWVAILG